MQIRFLGAARETTSFQGNGSLGRCVVGRAQRVRLFDKDVPVRASIHTLNGYSAHGEAEAATEFAERLRTDKGWLVSVPELGAKVDLGRWPQ